MYSRYPQGDYQGNSLMSMVTHWTQQIIDPEGRSSSYTSEFDIMKRFMVDVIFRQYLQEYARLIIKGERTTQQLEIELMMMREEFAVNWLSLKMGEVHPRAFDPNRHGHTLKTCYENLENPNYRHTGHSAAGHKCLWEYYLHTLSH